MNNNITVELKPIVFCNIGWCRNYLGEENDPLFNGGSYVKINNTGNEHINYLPFTDVNPETGMEELIFLGSYETKHTRGINNQTHIENIHCCRGLSKDDYVDDVIVVWCATDPNGSSCVVGWYNHARIYRNYEVVEIMQDDGYTYERWFNIMSLAKDAVLLPVDVRRKIQWKIPRHSTANKVPFGVGSSNIWYASEPEAELFVKQMIYRIDHYSGLNINPSLELF